MPIVSFYRFTQALTRAVHAAVPSFADNIARLVNQDILVHEYYDDSDKGDQLGELMYPPEISHNAPGASQPAHGVDAGDDFETDTGAGDPRFWSLTPPPRDALRPVPVGQMLCAVNAIMYRADSLRPIEVLIPAIPQDFKIVSPNLAMVFAGKEFYRAHVVVGTHSFMVAGVPFIPGKYFNTNILISEIAPNIHWHGDLILFSLGHRVQFHSKPAASTSKCIRNAAIKAFVTEVYQALGNLVDGDPPPTVIRAEL